MLAAIAWDTAVTTALATAVADFEEGLAAAIPAILGLAVAGLVFRRVKGFIR